MLDREKKLRKLLLNEDVLSEADGIAGDYRFSAAKEMSDKQAKLTDKEKNDNGRDDNKKTDDSREAVAKIQEIDKTLNDIDDLRAENYVTQEDETTEVPEKHKRVKMLDQFREMFMQAENMISILDDIIVDDVTKNELAIFDELYTSLKKLHKKLEHYIVYGFLESKYEKIVYVYTHLRSELLLITKIIRKVLHVREQDFKKSENKK